VQVTEPAREPSKGRAQTYLLLAVTELSTGVHCTAGGCGKSVPELGRDCEFHHEEWKDGWVGVAGRLLFGEEEAKQMAAAEKCGMTRGTLFRVLKFSGFKGHGRHFWWSCAFRDHLVTITDQHQRVLL